MNVRGPIRAITFDVGGTLLEPFPSVGHVYADVAARHGATGLSADLLNDRFRSAWAECRAFDYTRAGWEELVQRTFNGLLTKPMTFFPALYDRFAEPGAWQIFADVVPTLETLRARGLRLGVISNWDERLRGLLQRLELDRYFISMAISCEVGCAKPGPAIFQRAEADLGIPASAILHVGDSQEMDVRGARTAGFQAVRIVRAGSGAGGGGVQSLAELLSVNGGD